MSPSGSQESILQHFEPSYICGFSVEQIKIKFSLKFIHRKVTIIQVVWFNFNMQLLYLAARSNLFLQTWFVQFNILILQFNICSHLIWLHAHPLKPSIHRLTSGKRFIFCTFAVALIIETCSCLTFQMFHSKCHIFLNRFWGPLSPSLSLFLDLQMKLSWDGVGTVDLL